MFVSCLTGTLLDMYVYVCHVSMLVEAGSCHESSYCVVVTICTYFLINVTVLLITRGLICSCECLGAKLVAEIISDIVCVGISFHIYFTDC